MMHRRQGMIYHAILHRTFCVPVLWMRGALRLPEYQRVSEWNHDIIIGTRRLEEACCELHVGTARGKALLSLGVVFIIPAPRLESLGIRVIATGSFPPQSLLVGSRMG